MPSLSWEDMVLEKEMEDKEYPSCLKLKISIFIILFDDVFEQLKQGNLKVQIFILSDYLFELKFFKLF